MARSMFRKAVQQGRSKRRGESYFLPYVEPLSAARTPLADFINRLLEALTMNWIQPVQGGTGPINRSWNLLMFGH
jgi:hypothetical protein